MCNTLFRFIALAIILGSCFAEASENGNKWPTVGIAVLVRNKAHTLPYFLSCLRDLDYPKDRIDIWINSDYNNDNSDEILKKWVAQYNFEYHGVRLVTDNSTTGTMLSDQNSPHHWSPKHFQHVIDLREQGLNYMRQKWADYIFMIDADVFLINTNTLKELIQTGLPVVAPMLLSEGIYSNFWGAMNEAYYYIRSDNYMPILNRDERGCFEVPMVHTAVLIDLRTAASDALTYRPTASDIPNDDIIAFAVNAQRHKIPLHICNKNIYGFATVPLEENDMLGMDLEQLVNIKLDAISYHSPLVLDPFLEEYVQYPEPSKFGCNEIYMINLERRTQRREMMQLSFRELGMNVKLFTAIDGRNLDMSDLQGHSITLMPGYEDPYHSRSMKAGEIGCFLSHYYIWKEIVANKSNITMVLEDDIHFEAFFRIRFLMLMTELQNMDWDLVYIGRKILSDYQEEYVSDHTTRPHYSYWTIGYLLSLRGARKLLAAQPLNNMLPVDEFLPIMFDKHPNATWKNNFPDRTLTALSAAPLLIHPTHYTGQEGYISDTEDSHVLTPFKDEL